MVVRHEMRITNKREEQAPPLQVDLRDVIFCWAKGPFTVDRHLQNKKHPDWSAFVLRRVDKKDAYSKAFSIGELNSNLMIFIPKISSSCSLVNFVTSLCVTLGSVLYCSSYEM